MENVSIVLNGRGADCSDPDSDECTMNVDIYDAESGELLENRNITTVDEGAAPPQCNAQPGDEVCGHSNINRSTDCGDGANSEGGSSVDGSCGCNPAEGDQGCCFQKTGHSVYLASGIYAREDTDVSIVGQGLRLEFTRYFNSSRAKLGFQADHDNNVAVEDPAGRTKYRRWREYSPDVLGYGWRHRYQERIRVLMPRFLNGGVGYEAENLRPIIYYRSDGVGHRFNYNHGHGEYDSVGTVDRLVRENLSGQEDPEGQIIVIVKPSGERHIFSMPAGYSSLHQPLDVRLTRIESFNAHGLKRGGMDFEYLGCGGEGSRICRIVMDDGSHGRGIRFEYDDAGRIERLRALDETCLAEYDYGQTGALEKVWYNSSEGTECDRETPFEYQYEIDADYEPIPSGVFTCRRDGPGGECEWICGEDEQGRCLPLMRTCEPPGAGGSCAPYCELVAGQCVLAGSGSCGFPDDNNACPDGCELIEQITAGSCVSPNGDICGELSYGDCVPYCMLDAESGECLDINGDPCGDLVDRECVAWGGNGNGNGQPCEIDPESLIAQYHCVPSAGSDQAVCAAPSAVFPFSGGFSGGEVRDRCAYSIFERELVDIRMTGVIAEDGIVEEEIGYIESHVVQDYEGRVSYVANPHGTTYYNYFSDRTHVHDAQQLTYSVHFGREGLPVRIEGQCGCGPVREIGWTTTATGGTAVKWMSIGGSGGGESFVVYDYDDYGRVSRVAKGAADSEGTDIDDLLHGGQLQVYEYSVEGWERGRRLPTKVRTWYPVPLELEGVCPSGGAGDPPFLDSGIVEFDYSDSQGQPTDRLQAVIRKGSAITVHDNSFVTCDWREETTSFSYQADRLHVIDGPRLDVEDDKIEFTYSSGGDDDGRIHKITQHGAGDVIYENYNRFGLPERMIDQNQQEWTMAYDARGRLAAFTRPGAANPYQLQYHQGRLARVILPRGNAIEYLPRQPYGSSTIIEAMALRRNPGDRERETAEFYRGFKGELEMVKLLDDLGAERYHYWSLLRHDGNVSKIFNTHFDGMDYFRSFAYDELDRLASVDDELYYLDECPRLEFGYDVLNRVGSISTGRSGNCTSEDSNQWHYDPVLSRQYGYDNFGGLQTTKDFGLKESRYIRDQFGRVTLITTPDSGNTWLSY
ncbi:MAG: hypothetical protein ABIK85_01480, partial [Candidatus Eisenbacteria bacterium]